MTETPTVTLRCAAEKLRGLADVATPGPWRNHDTHLNYGDHTATVLASEGNDTRLLAWLPTFGNGQFWDEKRNVWNDSQYIAAMHPGVALLIADWLDAEAGAHEGGMATSEGVCNVLAVVGAGEHAIQVAVSTLDQALAVARAILGEEGAR